MSHLRIWQALIGCVIALAGLLGCQSSATKQGIRVDPTLWAACEQRTRNAPA